MAIPRSLFQPTLKSMKYDIWLLNAYLGSGSVASTWSRDKWRFDSTEHALVTGLPGGMDERGSVSVFGRNGGSWCRRSMITASDGKPGDRFGFQVAMQDDVIVVTAPFAAERAGAAYVYRWDGHSWCEEQKLVPVDSGRDLFFGGAVDIEDEVIAVGSGHGGRHGAVYVFERHGPSWEPVQKLQPEDASTPDDFGHCLSMENDEIVVGAPTARGGGAAYVYSNCSGSWTQTQRLTSLRHPADEFGRHVAHALGEQTLIVGASVMDEDEAKHAVAQLFGRLAGRWQPLGALAPNRSH